MTPFAKAAEAHLSLGSHWTFAQLMEAHAAGGGYVFITPDLFLMVRPVNTDWSNADLSNPGLWSADPNCWHCWLFAGDPGKVLAFLPYPLPFVSFHRRGRLVIQPAEKVARLTSITGSRTTGACRGTVAG